MYRVVFIEPTSKTCGGDASWEKDAGESYATYPTAVVITQRKPKDFRMVKQKNTSFFDQLGLNLEEYCVSSRGYDYKTLEEAIEKKYYEVRNRGGFVRGTHCWFKIFG